MMKKGCLFLLILLFPLSMSGQYRVSEIPAELKKNANAVIRSDVRSFDVTSKSSARFKRKAVITILNAKAKWLSDVVVGYDKLSRVKFNSAYIYDENGKQVYKLKKADIGDQSSISGFSVYEDNRLKYLELYRPTYPYTIAFEYETTYEFLYGIPNWMPITGQHVAVEKASYSLTAPSAYAPRVKNNALAETAFSESSQGGRTVYQWNYSNLKPVEREPYGPAWTELVPYTLTSPSKFDYDGYEGDFTTWDGLAKWQNRLNEGRDFLPVNTLQKVKELAAAEDNDRAKIKAIYEYLQSKTRYVSIQLGIGGFQPFPAIEVDELGYGDCKALSFYTQSLLKAVGIDAHYTWVEAGDNPDPVYPEFPADTFNHIILCVPNKGDTVWLECTSQTNPFGYMGSFTGDRDVVLITESGAKIVHTPVYDETTNLQTGTVAVTIDAEGNALAEATTAYQGLKYEDDNLNFIVEKGSNDQRTWVMENTQLPDFELKAYDMTLEKSELPVATVSAAYNINKYAKVTGKRLFFGVNPLNKVSRWPRKVKERETGFVLKQAFTEKDSVTFNIPEGYNFEYIPEGAEIESPFGRYSSSVKTEEGKLVYTREFVLWKGEYDPEQYNTYLEFLQSVATADAAKVVVNGKT